MRPEPSSFRPGPSPRRGSAEAPVRQPQAPFRFADWAMI
jgi:hypothetical protein